MRVHREWSSLLVLIALLGAGTAGSRTAVPAADRIPELASELASRLTGKSVRTPDARDLALYGEPNAVPAPLLTAERLVQCLTTVHEAAAWPETWLIVQDASRDFDLVLRIRLGEDARVADPEPLFIAPRREWDSEAVGAAARAATGRKPPRVANVVIQSFSTRTETTYVYEPTDAGRRAQGLLALLPNGSIIREARRVDLGDAAIHTVALVLGDPKFVPSGCRDCRERERGHVDAGAVQVVVAGEKAIEDRLDLAGVFAARGLEPFLPRFACRPGDDAEETRKQPVNERFRDREPEPLMRLVDLDRDGKAREILLDLAADCQVRFRVALALLAEPPSVRLLEAR